MRFTRIGPYLLALLMLFSCEKRPDHVISDKKMISIMADMEMGEAYVQTHGINGNSEEAKKRVVSYILKKNGVSRADFDASIEWYGRNIDKYSELYAKVDQELARREKKMSGSGESESNVNDLWPYSRHIAMSRLASSDNVAFSLPRDEESKGEKITWRVHFNTIPTGNIMLGVNYADGSAGYVSRSTTGQRNIDISFQSDTSRRVSNIFGNLRITDRSGANIWIDSITLRTEPFDSVQYYRINSQRFFPRPAKRASKIATDTAKSVSEAARTIDAMESRARQGENAARGKTVNLQSTESSRQNAPRTTHPRER